MLPAHDRPSYLIPHPPRPAAEPPPPQPVDAALYLRTPCPFLPGTLEKIDVLAARRRARVPMFLRGDAVLGDRQGYLPGEHLGGLTPAAACEVSPAGEVQIIGLQKAPLSAKQQISGYKLNRRIAAQQRRAA